MRAPIATVAAAVKTDPTFALHAVRSGKNDISFRATVAGKDSGGAPVTFEVSGDDGKLRAFKDADDFIKAAGGLGMFASDASITVDGLALVAPKPFSGDILKKSAATVAAYTKRVASGQERSTKIDQELTLMNQTPGVSPALIAEKQAQKTAVDENVTWLQAEIVRINGLIGA